MDFFISFIGMSVQSTIVIGVVFVLRMLFKKLNISKKYVMMLWMVPFICMIIPWKISSPVGFWNSSPAEYTYESIAKTIETTNNDMGVKLADTEVSQNAEINIGANTQTHFHNKTNVKQETNIEKNINVGMDIGANTQNHVHNKTNFSNEINNERTAKEQVITALMVLWGVVVAILYLYSVIAYGKLKKQLRQCVRIRRRVYFVDDIPVPMVVGMFQPKIYIPSGVEREHIRYVVAHEETHIRRNDMAVKLIAYCITCLHWFNPLVWLSYNLMVKDMEMACDEETILRLGQEKKKDYATALLQLATGKRNVFAIPLAFGEGSTKARIKNIVKYKKTKQILAVLAVTIGVVITAVFMTKGTSESGKQVAKNVTSKETVVETQTKDLEEEHKDVQQAQENLETQTEETKSLEEQYEKEVEEVQKALQQAQENVEKQIGELKTVEEVSAKEAEEAMKIVQQAHEDAEKKMEELKIAEEVSTKEMEENYEVLKEETENSQEKSEETKATTENEITETSVWTKENNMLTEDKISWFENSFFNNQEGGKKIVNMFLATKYSSPEDVKLSELFYCGADAQSPCVEYESQERKMLVEKYQIPDWDTVQIPEKDMNTVLNNYMDISLDETNKNGIDELYYLEEYETYYNVAGDSMWDYYDILSGWVNENGTVTLQYCQSDRLTSVPDTTNYLVTLKEENGNYYFISNVKE